MTPIVVDIAGERMLIRDAIPEDVSLIFSTWIQAAKGLRQVRLSIFNSHYAPVVRRLLETEPAVVMTREGGTAIHAWACGRPPNLLHFAYVPASLRGNGFGRAVMSAVLGGYPESVYVTSSPLAIPNHRRFQFNPFTRAA